MERETSQKFTKLWQISSKPVQSTADKMLAIAVSDIQGTSLDHQKNNYWKSKIVAKKLAYGEGKRLCLLEITCVDEILFGQEIKSLVFPAGNMDSFFIQKICLNKSQNMKKLVALIKYCIKFNKVLFSTAFFPGYSTGWSAICLQHEVLTLYEQKEKNFWSGYIKLHF